MRESTVLEVTPESQPHWAWSPDAISHVGHLVKVWMSPKHHGLSRYAEAIERDLALAEHLAQLVDASPDLQRLAAGRQLTSGGA